MFFLFLFLSQQQQFILDAIVRKDIPTSLVAQVINVTLPFWRINSDLRIIIEPKHNLPYLFYSDQAVGPKMKYYEDVYNRRDIFVLNTRRLDPQKTLFFSFKTVSSFTDIQSIKVTVEYSIDKFIDIAFVVSLIGGLFNIYTTNCYVILLSFPIAYFLQKKGLFIFGTYIMSLVHLYIRNKKFNKLILLFYTLLYFVTYSPVCYLCAFFLVNFNTHQSFMSRIFSVAYLIALIPVKDLNTDKGVEIQGFIFAMSMALQACAILFTHVKYDITRNILMFIMFGLYFFYSISTFTERKEIDQLSATVTIEPFVLRTPAMDYQTDWIPKLLEEINKTHDTSKCPLCNFDPVISKSGHNSTPRDFVVVTGFGEEFTNVDLFVRTLRTTGSKANILFFTNLDLMKPELYEILKNCGVIFVDVSAFKNFDPITRRKARFPLIFDLLNTAPQYFDRIMYLDLFDSIFQGDPFTPELNSSILNGGLECGYIRLLWSWRRVRRLPGYDYTPDLEKMYANSGWFVGNSSIVKTIVSMEVAMYGPNFRNIRTNDQIMYNWLIFSNNFKRAGIPYYFREVETSEWPSISKNTFTWYTDKLGNFTNSKTLVRPLLIHQYDRNFYMTPKVVKQCPGNFYKLSYIPLSKIL